MNPLYFMKERMGTLELILGPMFSGKTKLLISRYNDVVAGNGGDPTNKILVVNYYKDTRYAINRITSHDGDSIPSVNIILLSNIFELYGTNELNTFKFIFINEAQFFPDLKEVVLRFIEHYNKTIILCGLDSDFKQEKFGQLWDLIPHADTLIKLYGKCDKCPNKSLYTHRLSKEVIQEVIGTTNYIPLCRSCYNEVNHKS